MRDGCRGSKEVEAMKRDVSKMSVKQVVEMAITLRKAADSTEVEFVEFLVAVEATDVWRAASSGTFESFLVRQHVCAAERYSRGKRALAECPEEVVKIGIQATKQAIRIEDHGQRNKALAEMQVAAKDQGYPLSEWTAGKIATKYLPQKVRVGRVDELEVENRQLRQEVQRLKAEVRDLRERLGVAEDASGARTGGKVAAQRATVGKGR